MEFCERESLDVRSAVEGEGGGMGFFERGSLGAGSTTG